MRATALLRQLAGRCSSAQQPASAAAAALSAPPLLRSGLSRCAAAAAGLRALHIPSEPNHAPQEPPAAASSSWIHSARPPWLRPYLRLARLDAPAGTWLLLWPGCWSIALAAPPGSLPDPSLLALFATGAVLLRGAGCTVNDMWDRKLDAQVERTRSRPLPSGELSPAQAAAFLGAQLTAGLGVLLQLPQSAQVLGVAALPLVATYPLMKRITNWPQLFLGFTFNWGALMGWAAAAGEVDWSVALPLYGAGVAWTLVYDTIYAHQDAKDDLKVGIRSTALRFGQDSKVWLAGFGGAMLAGLAAAGAAADVGSLYYAGLGATGVHLAWQIGSVELDSPPDCAAKFRSNSQLGGLIFASCVLGRFF